MSKTIQKEIQNLTPHNIIVDLGNEKIIYPASGSIARVSQNSIDTETNIDGVPLYVSTFGEVQIPPKQKDVIYLVSGLVFAALKGTRRDVIAPKTDNTAIRDERGHITAITGFLTVE